MYMCQLSDPIVAKDTLDVFKYFRATMPNYVVKYEY